VSTGHGPIVLVDVQAERLRATVAFLRHAFGPAEVRGTTDVREAAAWLTYERPSVLVTCADTAATFGTALLDVLRSHWGPVPVVVTRAAPPNVARSSSDPVTVPVDPVQLRAEVARWARPGAGAIAITLLADVLALHARAGRTGVLEVRSPGRTGSIWFEAGRPVHALCGDRVGKPALFEVLCWNAGRFVFGPGTAPARTLEQDLGQLLAEADAIA